MKSKQLNFFFDDENFKNLQSFFRKNNIYVIKQPLYDISNIDFGTSIIEKSEREFDKIYFTSEQFIRTLKFDFIETMNYYLVNDYISCVIELDRGLFVDSKLNRSRLYYVKNYYDNEGFIINKEEVFIEWADDIFKKIKKYFLIKQKTTNTLITKSVLEWKELNNKTIDTSGLVIS